MIQKLNTRHTDTPVAPSSSTLLTPQQVAEMLGISEATLSTWRCRGRYHLPYVKVGSRVMYEPSSVEEFKRERTRGIQEEV